MAKFFKFLIVVMILSFIAGIITVPLSVEYFNINQVEVQNNYVVKQDTILNLSEEIISKNIFIFPKTKISKSIMKRPQIKKVKYKRVLPNKIIISVTEKAPWINLIIRNNTYIISKDGTILNTEDSNPIDSSILPVIKSNDGNAVENNRIDLNFLSTISSILKELRELFRDEELRIDLNRINDINILADDILTIKIGTANDIKAKKASLQTILKYTSEHWEDIEYIDIKSAAHPAIMYKKTAKK